MTISTLTLRDPQAKSFDVEAQQHTTARQSNVNLTRAKLVAMATVSAASGLATALLMSAAAAEPDGNPGRTLSDSGCSDNQLRAIENSKRALVISGIVAGSGLGGIMVGGCLMGGGMELREMYSAGVSGDATSALGVITITLGGLGFMAGVPSTIISGIIHGVQKVNAEIEA